MASTGCVGSSGAGTGTPRRLRAARRDAWRALGGRGDARVRAARVPHPYGYPAPPAKGAGPPACVLTDFPTVRGASSMRCMSTSAPLRKAAEERRRLVWDADDLVRRL